MPAEPSARPARVAILALPELTPTAPYGLYELFEAVGVAWQELTGEAADCRRIAARIVSLTGAPFLTRLGLPFSPQARMDETGQNDVVIVTDLALAPDERPHARWPEEAAWVRRQYEGGATVCSVCTGSVFLAEAGLLDGEEATTHWGATGLFEACYPAVRLRPERVLCAAGPAHRIVTSGGAASWEELALYLIARLCGPAEAVRIAKVFVLGDRSEGQLPFAAAARPRGHEDPVIARCQGWIAEHYAAPRPVARMVAESRLPERTFKRRFKAATGYAPVDYVQTLRIEEAKQLLETTDMPTDGIAREVGYEDPAFFRRLFRRRTGVTPARYRQRFRGIARPPA